MNQKVEQPSEQCGDVRQLHKGASSRLLPSLTCQCVRCHGGSCPRGGAQGGACSSAGGGAQKRGSGLKGGAHISWSYGDGGSEVCRGHLKSTATQSCNHRNILALPMALAWSGVISMVRFLNLSTSSAASTYSFFTRRGCTLAAVASWARSRSCLEASRWWPACGCKGIAGGGVGTNVNWGLGVLGGCQCQTSVDAFPARARCMYLQRGWPGCSWPALPQKTIKTARQPCITR